MATQESIQNLPTLTWRDIFTLKDGESLSESEQASLNEYFSQFVDPPKNDNGETLCLGCGSAFYKDGLMSALLGGAPGRATWEWSIAHGVCHCSRCGWPARAYHYDIGKNENSEPIIKRLNVTLPFHPRHVNLKPKLDEVEA